MSDMYALGAGLARLSVFKYQPVWTNLQHICLCHSVYEHHLPAY